MTLKDLETLFDYGYWANDRLFAVLARVTPDEFTRSVAGSYGSVRNTLVHMMSAEWGWVDRCGGTARGPALVAADYPTVSSVISRSKEVEGYVRGFLATLGEDDLHRVVEFTLGAGPTQAMPLGALMHHAANHGVHHRGQVALLLRELGHAPGNADVLFYYARTQSADSLLRPPG